MKLSKRIVGLLLVTALMFGMMTGKAGVSAASLKKGDVFKSGSLKYRITSLKKKQGTVMVVGGKSKEISSVIIPQTVKKGKYSLNVTAIGQKAFAGYKKLTKVTIKTKNLVKIGNGAFTGTDNAIIEVPESKLGKYESLFEKTGKKPVSAQTVTGSDVPNTVNNSVPVIFNVGDAVNMAVNAAVNAVSDIRDESEKTSAPETETPKISVLVTAAPATKSPEVKAPAQKTQTPVVKTPEAKVIETTDEPTIEPTAEATAEPTAKPTDEPAAEPTAKPTDKPTAEPTAKPTDEPTAEPTAEPTDEPTAEPIEEVPHVHEYNWVLSVKPTCTEAGKEVGECLCGAVETVVIPMTGHSIIKHAAVSETCTSEGRTEYQTCLNCDYATESQVIPKHEHQFSEWRTTKKATCYTTGEEIRVCDECGYTETKHINSGHILEPHPEMDKPASCLQRGEKHSHCILCGQEFFHYTDYPVGHDYQLVEEEATCTKEGAVYKKCTRCGDIIDKVTSPKLGHDWGEIIPADVTCTEGGYEYRRCNRCHIVKEASYVCPQGHKYTGYQYNNDATCLKRGTESARCIYCGHTVTKLVSAEPPGHFFIHHDEVPATCEKDGSTAYTSCVRCGEYEDGKEPEVIPAKGHIWGEEKVCDSVCNGYVKYRECTVCKARDVVESRPGEGHNWVEYTNSEGDVRLRCGNEGCGRYQPYTNEEFRLHNETGAYKDAVRVVWGVIYQADMRYCEGFTNYRGVQTDMIWPTAIPADVVFEIKAPEPKAGYRFVKWIDVRTGETVSEDMVRHDDWRNMDRVFRAVYEPVDK